MPLSLPRTALSTVHRCCAGQRSYATFRLKPPSSSILRKVGRQPKLHTEGDSEEVSQSPPPAGQSDKEFQAAYENRVPTRKDHPLYLFFHKKHTKKNLYGEPQRTDGEHKYVTLHDNIANSPLAVSGRAWRPEELRIKDFNDLHVLWYLSLRERNILATQKEEARRLGLLGIPKGSLNPVNPMNRTNVQRTMKRIKVVLNERRVAYEDAVKVVQKQREAQADKMVLAFKKKQFGPVAKDSTKQRWSEEEKLIHGLIRERQTARKQRKIRKRSKVEEENTLATKPQSAASIDPALLAQAAASSASQLHV